MKKSRKRKINHKNIIIISSFLILFFLTITYGRYIYRGIRNYYLSTKNFYFNSDKLTEDMSYYQLDNWSGVEPVTITINMDSKKNNIVASTDNIEYSIDFTCSSNVTCVSSKNSGLIMNGNNTDSFTITMTPNVTLHGGDSVWLEVETSATEPYTKSLSGKFTINVGDIGLSYEIVDSIGSPYLDFNITNTLDYYKVLESFGSYSAGDRIEISEYLALSEENRKHCTAALITLTFDPNLFRLDMTNEAYLQAKSTTTRLLSDGYDYLNSVTFGTDALSSTSIRFYKLNTNNNYTYPFVTDTPVISFSSE